MSIRYKNSSIAVDTLEGLYNLRDQAEVLWFLENNSFLVPLLVETHDQIRNHFPFSQIFLQVMIDPEEADEGQLVVFIAADLSPDEVIERLGEFDRNWWLEALGHTRGKLCVHTVDGRQ